jgi:hypothetical protein
MPPQDELCVQFREPVAAHGWEVADISFWGQNLRPSSTHGA